MSLKIYTSRQAAGENPAREKVLANCVNSYKKTKFNKRRKMFILTPKQDTYQVEREIIDLVGESGLLGMQIIDFDTFILKMIEEDRHNTQVVDEHGRLMLVQKSLLDVSEQLDIYRGSVKEPNFKNAVLEQIGELKQAQITPELIDESLDEIEDGLLKRKLADISLILEAFNNNLGEENYDNDDLLSLAIELIPDSSFLKDLQLFCIDENSMPYQEILFLTIAAQKVKQIEIALNTDTNPTNPDSSTFIIPNQILRSFEELSKEYGIKLNIKNLKLKMKQNSLDWLSHEFFSYYPQSYSGQNNSVQIYEARNPWDEVNQVAQQILLDHNTGVPFSKIAVASNSPEDYESIIRRVFSQYEIPYFIDENHKVIDNHFIQFLLSALDTIQNNFNRSDILSFIKNDFSDLSNDQMDLIENYVIETGIKPREWSGTFKRIPKSWGLDKKTLTEEDEIIQIQKKILGSLKPFRKAEKEEKSVSEFIDLIQEFLMINKCQDQLEDLSELLSENEQQELSSRYRQIWNILQEILIQMKSAIGNVTVNFSDFITILKSGIASYEVGVIPEDSDAVIISSVNRTVLPEIENLYFLGLNEELLPLKKNDETLLTDYDKEQLIKHLNVSNHLIKDRRFRSELEEINLYSLLTKPKKKLTFTYHTFTGGGEQDFPSRYLDVLKQIYKKDLFIKPAKFFNLLSPRRANVILENFINKTDYQKLRKILEEWFKDNKKENNINAIQSLSVKPQDFLIKVDARDLYQLKEKNNVSISRLENFASCPFKHFINYGLRLRDREEFEIRNFDTGIIIHEIFNQFLSNVLKKSDNNQEKFHNEIELLLNDDEKFNELLDKVFEMVIAKLEEFQRYNHTAASRHLISKVKRVCKVALRLILEQLKDSGFMPVDLERYFYHSREDDINIEGRIDRIDVKKNEDGSESVRVIDYKTRNRSVDYIDLLYGKSLQLSIYLIEALQDHLKEDAKPKGAYYFIAKPSGNFSNKDDIEKKLRDKFKMNGINLNDNSEDEDLSGLNSKNSPGRLTEEEMDLLLDHSSNLIGSLTEALGNGDISINPVYIKNQAESCQYCAYNDICHFNPNDLEYDFKKINPVNKEQFFEELKKEAEVE